MMDGTLMMFLIFILIVAAALGVLWYNKKYGKKINVGTVIILLFFSIALVYYLAIKNMATGEKERIIENISLETTVVEISLDPHKPYFKNMLLADGQVLPMPEPMNSILQVGDSIYKTKGQAFYTVVTVKTNVRTSFDVKVHERLLSKPQ